MNGGTDGSYSYITGNDSGGHNPGDDLRPYKIPWQFVFQGQHLSAGSYTDTFDLNIKKGAAGGSLMRVGMTSNIHGALGDNGNSYKIIAYMLKALADSTTKVAIDVKWGCGAQ
jgi:hypothetical protein